MYETIYIEKNKNSRCGVHFYEDASKWELFKDTCGIVNAKQVLISNCNIQKDEWKAFAHSFQDNDIFEINDLEPKSREELADFFEKNGNDATYIVLLDEVVMDYLYEHLSSEEIKYDFIFVPVTPGALFNGVSIRPFMDETGEIIRKECLPLAIYLDVSLLQNASGMELQSAIASAFRLSISYKASLFEWMISNMYELTDLDKNAVCEFLEKGIQVLKERIEKDTAKERSLATFGDDFYKVFKAAGLDLPDSDLLSLSMVCQSYLSWKMELISMEEFYEIRDMFVFFGLSISQVLATPDELLKTASNLDLDILKENECVYIRKVGKLKLEKAPGRTLVQEAFEQIYFDEDSNE